MSIFKLKSIEDASVVRKFSVLFSLMSFFPFLILSALFFYLNIKGILKLNLNFLFYSAFLVGVFALIGFFGMRRSLVNLNKISQTTQDILKGDMSPINISATGNNEVSQIARAFNEVVQKLEVNIQELRKSKGLLQEVLSRVASGVSSAENINAFLDLILKTTVNALSASSGLLLLSAEEKNELSVKSCFGLACSSYSRGQCLPIETEVVGWVAKEGKPLFIPRLHKIAAIKEASVDSVFQPPLICTPLIFQNKVVGVLLVSGKEKDANFQEDELIILSNLASQIALAIANEKLNADAQETYLETVTALAMAVEARDPYSRGHSDRVSKYAVKVAQVLGLDDANIKKIKEAAQLHDVGKIGISDGLLKKPGKLDEYEEKIMHQHPVIGEGIIIPMRGFSDLRDPIRHHHEWLNGDGYPDHLKDGEISLDAKILAVVDAFDAMTTERPYRKALDFDSGKKELLRYKDIRYDSKVVDAFISCI